MTPPKGQRTARDICDRCDNSGKRLVEFGGVTMWLCLTCLMTFVMTKNPRETLPQTVDIYSTAL